MGSCIGDKTQIPSLGKDTCAGDAGGPMVSLSDNGYSYELIGLTSWGYGCADPSYPGTLLFTNRLFLRK